MPEKSKKIREFSAPQGRAGTRMERVRELAADEPVPGGAELVDDKTEIYNWKPEEKK